MRTPVGIIEVTALYGDPYAANAGAVKRGQLVSVPLKPQVVSGTTYIVGTMTAVRPTRRIE